MKIGLVSAILEDYDFKKMIDTVSEIGYECVEVACWPKAKAERRYAGVSHIDVTNLGDKEAEEILLIVKKRMWRFLLWHFIRTPWMEIWKKELQHRTLIQSNRCKQKTWN